MLMQGVRSPFLRLDNLVAGDYTFRLKVTDVAGQENTADVRVFVKPGLSFELLPSKYNNTHTHTHMFVY